MTNKSDNITFLSVLEEQFSLIFEEKELKFIWLDFAKKCAFPGTYECKQRLAKLKSSVLKDKEGLNKRDYLNFARIVYFMYAIDYRHFSIDEKDFFPKKALSHLSAITKLEMQERHESSKLFDLRIGDGKTTSDFKDAYEEAVQIPIKNMTDSLIVYDYLEKQNYRENKYYEMYSTIHEGIYQTIEDKLENKNFKYKRILALPIHFRSLQNLSKYGPLSARIMLESAFDICSVPLFKHIYSCLAKYGNRNDGGIKPEFYIVPDARWAFHWGVVDEGKYIITEYYRYDKDGFCKPQILFVEGKQNVNSRKLASIYLEDFNRLLKPYRDEKNLDISFNSISKAIERLNSKAELEINELMKAYDDALQEEGGKSNEAQLIATLKYNAEKHTQSIKDKYDYVFSNKR